MTHIDRLLDTRTPDERPDPPAPGSENSDGQGVTVYADRLKAMAGPADDAQRHIRAGVSATAPDSDRAASSLGVDWASATALRQLTAGWEDGLNKLAGEIGGVGPKMLRTADNHLLAEAVNRQAVQAITKALGR
ncbi:hypothetical protein [Actinomadura parmotrematis]|uniref:Uncharacterized protein n=1 Tax=Actinomadura parmotrematis TaxID=2864039 RepID=A0ABS7FRJ4_9ACTN|nr:hypothetical protein [Actinomadura parmotrematis]MBW8482349.1 hypothetical protein [Actinomadura parmotrematis]